MIEHIDFDSSISTTNKYSLPDKIEEIEISHDGGRISISINGQEAYRSCSGTRDCAIKINKSEK